MSHICPGCGRELARVRPVHDAELGLRVVVCPGCGFATVRRRDAVVAGYRRARRIWIALMMLAAQLTAASLLALVLVGWIIMLEDFWRSRAHGSLAGLTDSFAGSGADRFEWIAVPILLACASAALGAWLSSCFPGRRRASLWTIATVVLLALLFFRLAVQHLVLVPLGHPGGLGAGYEGPDAALRVGLVSFVLLAATAGIPLGRLARWVAAGVGAQRRARYRRSRRRLLESA